MGELFMPIRTQARMVGMQGADLDVLFRGRICSELDLVGALVWRFWWLAGGSGVVLLSISQYIWRHGCRGGASVQDSLAPEK
jgi:hypothetical protein